jgi:hypothetical protein
MHQTTVRFGSDLWEALEHECARLGVSVAQYIREAALTRLVYAAGRRGDDEFEAALAVAAGDAATPASPVDPGERLDALVRLRAASASSAAAERSATGSESAAVVAQARLTRERARELRESAARERAETREHVEHELER